MRRTGMHRLLSLSGFRMMNFIKMTFIKMTFIKMTFMLLACLSYMPVLADTVAEETGSDPSQSVSVHISGTMNRINLSADHAEVLSVLKLVFGQAHRQFAPEGGVQGDVTLSLQGQTFMTVLGAICRQAMLTYEMDRNGIYRIYPNARALSEALALIRLQQRLRLERGENVVQALPAGRTLGGGFVGGGFGGGFSPGAIGGRGASSPMQAAPGTVPMLSPDSHDSAVDNQNALTPFDQMMRANGLVGVHVPSSHPVTVVSILKQFSRQSGERIQIDPQLLNNSDLKFDGNIVCPLMDALNLLSAVAHLQYHYLPPGEMGPGGYFVTTTPDFRIFYGLSSEPVTAYPVRQPMQSGAGGRARSAKRAPVATQPATPQQRDTKPPK